MVRVASMERIVLLSLSTSPSDWGWYGVVRDFFISNSLHTSVISADSKFLPWSECSCSGGEKRKKNSSVSFFATVVAS